MNTYFARKAKWDDYDTDARAYKNAETKICNGLKEVWEFCGMKLKRSNGTYSGYKNGIVYYAVRLKR